MPGFFLIDGQAYPAALQRGFTPPPAAIIAVFGDHVWLHLDGHAHELVWQDALTHFAEEADGAGDSVSRAPMPGAVIAVSVSPGDAVKAGEAMMVIESMKLETVIKAPRNGGVASIHFGVGDTFGRDAVLVTLAPEDAA